MKRLLLNCDLGEGESAVRTRALMREIDLANVACAGHAGDVASMETCLRLAMEHGVKPGAHPGYPDRVSRGRAAVTPTPEAFTLLLIQQIATLETVARRAGVRLHHVKLHGSLYHLTESSAPLRSVYLETLRRHWPKLTVIASAEGHVLAAARECGLKTLAEVFADRAYDRDGRLLPRTIDGALIRNARAIRTRMKSFIQTGALTAVNGELIRLRANTVCVHSDTAGSAGLARAVRGVVGR